MNDTLQQILVAAAILGALLYLVLRARRKQAKGGCGCVSKRKPLK
jgi:hypothetical protein